MVCQDPAPERFDLGGAQVVRPELDTRLPVFVIDRYEGLEPVLLQDMPAAERERYVARERGRAEGAAPGRPRVRESRADGRPGRRGDGRALRCEGARLRARVLDAGQRRARGVGGGVAAQGRTPSSSAPATSAGSSRRWSARSTASTRCRPASTSSSSSLSDRETALAGLLEEARADPPNPGNLQERLPDEGNAERLARVPRSATRRPSSTSASSSTTRASTSCSRRCAGVDARTLVVGFGDYRRELERIAPPRTLFTGPLEHRHLVHLIPLADVCVVPSIFPEAFGMVAAEAAAAGCPPLVARHSGLEEVAEGLEAAYPPELPAPRELRDRRLARSRRQAARAARPAARPRAGARRGRAAASRSRNGRGRASQRRLLEPFE